MNEYRLVDCDFYDCLESWATLRQICKIIYRNSSDEGIEVESQIVDVYAHNKADYIRLKDGTEIRLGGTHPEGNRLLSVNDLPILFADQSIYPTNLSHKSGVKP
jgi:Rho-binding antiterminator